MSKPPRRYWPPEPRTHLEPLSEVEWDPALFEDHSLRVSFHEAAHAVAAYLFGRETYSVEAHERRGRTLVPRSEDVVASAVCLLAAEAFERSIGLPFAGGRSDLDRATELLATRCSGPTLDEACRVVEEAAISLAASERFHALVFALGPVIAKERHVGASRIRRILEEADPERSARRESHSLMAGPWYEVTVHGRLVARGSDWAEGEAIARRTPGSLIVGSSSTG